MVPRRRHDVELANATIDANAGLTVSAGQHKVRTAAVEVDADHFLDRRHPYTP